MMALLAGGSVVGDVGGVVGDMGTVGGADGEVDGGATDAGGVDPGAVVTGDEAGTAPAHPITTSARLKNTHRASDPVLSHMITAFIFLASRRQAGLVWGWSMMAEVKPDRARGRRFGHQLDYTCRPGSGQSRNVPRAATHRLKAGRQGRVNSFESRYTKVRNSRFSCSWSII